jgi:hypothetical protein
MTAACTDAVVAGLLLLLQFEEMYKRLDDALTVISTQTCDLKTQVADVQVRVRTCAGGQNCAGFFGYLGLLLGTPLTSTCATCCCRGRQTTCAI